MRIGDSRLRLFYLRIGAGEKKKRAVIALARMILVIIYHLLVTGENCVEEGL
ncbi:MAG: hypothetical protein QXQ02_08605 [Halobacteria archaeon]